MEIHAINKCQVYTKEYKEVQLTECGLILHSVHPLIGGSLDRCFSCSCCEKACLEMKCTMSFNHASPLDNTVELAYLVKDDNNKLSINRILLTMGVTGLRKCFFFTCSSYGYFVEEICFDRELWDEMTTLFPEFCCSYVTKSLLG